MQRSLSWVKINPRRRCPTGLRRLFAFVLLLLLLGSAPSSLFAASFTATLDRETITVGESATLTLKFEGGEPRQMPAPPEVLNLHITGGASLREKIAVNGQVSESLSQTFALTPTQPGEFVIPPIKAEVDRQVLTTQPLKLTVVKASAPAADSSGEKLAFFKLFVPRKEVYVGEVLGIEFQVYIQEGVANGGNILEEFDRYGGCPFKVEGVSILKTAHAQRRRVRSGNSNYGVATLVTSITPVKTGPLTLSSMDVTLPLQIPLPNQRPDFFGRVRVEERRVALSAEPETLTVLPLPKENMPANFNGAVGSFSMTLSAGPTNVAAGDPVTVRIQISGRGAFDSLALPEQAAWRDFKTYPPTTKVEVTDALGLQGTKTFEQVVVPQSADIKTLPAISFSFFDPDQKSYRTLTQPPVALLVRPGGSAPAPTVVTANSRVGQDNPPPTQDIVHIKPRLGTLAELSPPLVLQGWFLALQAVPVLAWLSVVIWRRRVNQLANNPRLRRRRQVAQVVRQGLGELRQHAAEKKSDDFFATLFRLLQEQLGERLDLPASAITEAVIEEHLRPRGVPEAALTTLHELFQTCNLARYAPIKSSQELAAIIPKFETTLRDLQGVKLREES